jgi:histidyl-tRNA synthetase
MSSNEKPAPKTPARPPIKAVRGTRDLLPDQTPLWNHVETTARAVFARYGFGEIRTPIFEATELFARGVGEETDIVSKEMFTWPDRERFDKSALRDVWWRDAISKYPAWTHNVRLHQEKSSADEVFQNTDGGFTLVSFVEKPSKAVWQSLLNAVSAYRVELLANEVRGLLVYPADVGSEDSPTDILRENSERIDGWPVQGNFFASRQTLTLRPESTAGVVRAYIEHKLGETGQLQKLFYIGPQFRRERPQRGRYRQFWQIGAEVIGPQTSGAESPIRDAEVLEMLASLLDELGIRDWKLELNSVGNSDDRERYNIALREALAPVKDRLCPDNQRRAETNPLRVLDSKDEADQDIINALPKIADYLGPDSKAHFEQVLAALDACGVQYHVNPRLVRGLDYYTRTTFEFTVTTGLGTQNALLGGGRYDGLSEMLGGPKAPGIGFAIGEDRLILTLQAQAEADAAANPGAPHLASEMWVQKLDAYIAPIGAAQNAAALKLARDLRREGLSVEVGDGTFKLGKSFGFADRLARHVVLLGEDEVATGILTVKTFATAEQTKVERANLREALQKS